VPKLNIDELAAKRDPIEFTLGGKAHVVKNFTFSAMEQVKQLSKQQEAGEVTDEQAAAQTLSIFTGDPPEDFTGHDMRDLGAASVFVQQCIEEESEAQKASKKARH